MIGFIIQALLNDEKVKALVGKKVYAQVAPQGTPLPYVTCQQVSDVLERCRGGKAGGEARVQVNAHAATYTQCQRLYEDIDNALDGRQEGKLYCERTNATDLYREEGQAHVKAIDFHLQLS